MCGRYVLDFDGGDSCAGLEIPADIKNFNVAPTQTVPILVDHWNTEYESYERKLHAARWGLIPAWAREPGSQTFNARSETIFSKPTFEKAAVSGHCIFPVSGYYEWKTETLASGKQVKTPYFVYDAQGQPLLLAGLYEWWKVSFQESENPRSAYYGRAGQWVLSAAIVTMDSPREEDIAQGQGNTGMMQALSSLHARMPIPLGYTEETPEPNTVQLWLQSGQVAGAPSCSSARENAVEALQIIQQYTYRQVSTWNLHQVSSAVGKVSNNRPSLKEPVEDLLSNL